MSITVQDIINEFNNRVGDSSTDRFSASDRYKYITQGVNFVQEESLNDLSQKPYDLNYFDGIYYYDVTTSLPDLLETNDINTKILSDGGQPFTRKSAEELRAEIGEGFMEDSYAIERINGKTYLVVNHNSKYNEFIAEECDSLTSHGSWSADTSTSDATNLVVDTYNFTQGSGAFKFDIDVSQSGNNRATITNSTLPDADFSDDKDISSWLIDFQFPSVTYITSVTFKWGSSSSNYYSVTSTTDFNGNAFTAAEYITAKFNWLGATVTGTPDDEALTFLEITVNYSASQADATSFYVDNIRIVRPEKLRFYYTSWAVGTDASGNVITAFSATTDIPYFSGQYDQYKFPTADYAAARAFKDLRLYTEADRLEADARRSITTKSKIFPKSLSREVKSFKVKGINFRAGRGGNRKRYF